MESHSFCQASMQLAENSTDYEPADWACDTVQFLSANTPDFILRTPSWCGCGQTGDLGWSEVECLSRCPVMPRHQHKLTAPLQHARTVAFQKRSGS